MVGVGEVVVVSERRAAGRLLAAGRVLAYGGARLVLEVDPVAKNVLEAAEADVATRRRVGPRPPAALRPDPIEETGARHLRGEGQARRKKRAGMALEWRREWR